MQTPWFTLTDSASVGVDVVMDSSREAPAKSEILQKRAFDRLNWSPFDFGTVKRSAKASGTQKSESERFDSAYLPWYLP